MRSDVHLAALKAAAKVAFGVLVLNGCSATTEESKPDDTATDESAAYTKKKACHEEADAAVDAKPSCDAVLASAFPDAGAIFIGPNDGDAGPPVSADVKACCTEELTPPDGGFGWQSKYRWECCNVLGSWNSGDRNVAIACTPWGPPVPPSMARRRSFAGVA